MKSNVIFVALLFFLNPAFDEQADGFNPKTVIPHSFPAIKNVDSYPASADKVDLADDELVLGIEINGEARAYPINMLKGPYREIVNDDLGHTPIAATW